MSSVPAVGPKLKSACSGSCFLLSATRCCLHTLLELLSAPIEVLPIMQVVARHAAGPRRRPRCRARSCPGAALAAHQWHCAPGPTPLKRCQVDIGCDGRFASCNSAYIDSAVDTPGSAGGCTLSIPCAHAVPQCCWTLMGMRRLQTLGWRSICTMTTWQPRPMWGHTCGRRQRLYGAREAPLPLTSGGGTPHIFRTSACLWRNVVSAADTGLNIAPAP